MHEAILEKAEALAVVAGLDDGLEQLLSYSFVETIRNVFEHAGTDTCVVMAQRYQGRRAEIVIIDGGRGIHDSLEEAFPGISAEEALARCIQPGITRNVADTGRGKWENEGFGLYVLSELGRRTGSFSVWSSGFIHTVTKRGVTTEPTPPLRATAIKLVVNVDNFDVPNLLANIVQAGERQNVPGAVNKEGKSKSKYGWS